MQSVLTHPMGLQSAGLGSHHLLKAVRCLLKDAQGTLREKTAQDIITITASFPLSYIFI